MGKIFGLHSKTNLFIVIKPSGKITSDPAPYSKQFFASLRPNFVKLA